MDQTPRYRIHFIASETGLPASVLRAWERRYGVPNPQRAENGYRLYSDRDLAQVHRMKRLSEAGHSPAEAARRALEGDVLAPGVAGHTSFEGLASRLTDAALALDDDRMQTVHHAALALGSGWEMHARVLWPALQAVAQSEAPHAPAALLTLAARAECWQRAALRLLQPPPKAPLLVLAVAAGEGPALALRLGGLGLLAAQAGWRSLVLHQGVPLDALTATIQAANADLTIAWYAEPGRTLSLPGRWIAGGESAPPEVPGRCDDPDQVLAALRSYHTA